MKRCVYHLVATWKNTTGYSEKGWSRWCLVGCLPWPFLAVETVHGEGKCHLTSCADASPQTSQLASLPFWEGQKRMDGGLAQEDSLPFKQQPFLPWTSVCTEEPTQRRAPRSQRPTNPCKLAVHSTPLPGASGMPVGSLSLGGLTFSTFPPARGDHPPLRV